MAARHDTIAAIATAPGRGGVAVIRVSGDAAFDIARKVANKEPQVGRIVFSRFYREGKIIDEGLLLYFKAPQSFTGEDVVEFQCHGGTVTPNRLLDTIISCGARLARRGEFTERSFLNGKMSFEQAEALLDLIDAKTEKAADAALDDMVDRQGEGAKALVRNIYQIALSLSSTLEHSLDVDESDLPDEFFTSLATQAAELKEELKSAIIRLKEKRILRNGASIVLLGPPNAGKSSLMNALLGEERAIVSDIAGTTRDSIESWVDLEGWPVKLVDTAGIRYEGDDFGVIEAEGVRRSELLAKSADVVISFSAEHGGDERFIHINAKCDLVRGEGLNVSSVTGEGLSELRKAIVEKLSVLSSKASENELTSGERYISYLEQARSILEEADFSCPDAVLLGNIFRRIGSLLGEALGAEYSDDLLNNLFSRFCVGK